MIRRSLFDLLGERLISTKLKRRYHSFTKERQGKGVQDIHRVYIPPTYRQEKDAAIIAA